MSKPSPQTYQCEIGRHHSALISEDTLMDAIEDVPDGKVRKIRTKILPKESTKELNIEHLDAHSLETLRKQDVFMYYSIPQVRRAELNMQGIDTAKLVGASVLTRKTTPSRSIILKKVARKSIISFECHCHDLLMEDLLDELEEDVNDNDMASISSGSSGF